LLKTKVKQYHQHTLVSTDWAFLIRMIDILA
jgi:hypothetical protein